MNTMFSKDREKQITYKSGDCETQIDYVLLRQRSQLIVKDVKVIPGEACLAQHRLLVMDVSMQLVKSPRKKTISRKLKVWRLKEERKREEFEEAFKQRSEAQDEGGWDQFQRNILECAKEVLGETRGRPRQVQRETRWWNCDVQRAIRNKKLAYKKWQKSRNETHRMEYKQMSKLAKKEVGKARQVS